MKLFKNFKTKKQLRKEIEDLKKQLLEEEEINSILLGKTRDIISDIRPLKRVRFSSSFETDVGTSVIKEFSERRLLDNLMKQLEKYLVDNDLISHSLMYEKLTDTRSEKMLLDILIGTAPEN